MIVEQAADLAQMVDLRRLNHCRKPAEIAGRMALPRSPALALDNSNGERKLRQESLATCSRAS